MSDNIIKSRLERRLKRAMQAAALSQTEELTELKTEAELEKRLREFKKKIPEEFLNEQSLRQIEASLKHGFAKTLEEAVKRLEEGN